MRKRRVFLPKELHFSHGGFPGDTIDLLLNGRSIEVRQWPRPYESATVSNEYDDLPDTNEPHATRTPSDDEWRNFTQEMDRIDVWSWRDTYSELEIDDGPAWELKLRIGSTRVRSWGHMWYPDGEHPGAQFNGLLAALSAVSGVPIEKL